MERDRREGTIERNVKKARKTGCGKIFALREVIFLGCRGDGGKRSWRRSVIEQVLGDCIVRAAQH